MAHNLLNQRSFQLILILRKEGNHLTLNPSCEPGIERTVIHHNRPLLARRGLRFRVVVAVQRDLKQMEHIVRATALHENGQNNDPHGHSEKVSIYVNAYLVISSWL